MENKMRTVFCELEIAVHSGVFPRCMRTSAEVYDAVECVSTMLSDGSATTVQSAVAEFFKEHGFSVKTEGIGWRIAE